MSLATHQTILERFKSLPESGIPGQLVETAHDTELKAGQWLARSYQNRMELFARLNADWSREEIQAAGLLPIRNPRQILAEMETQIEALHFPSELAPLRELWRELSCTLEPFLSHCPEPPDGEGD